LNTHLSAAMTELIAARDWLTVYQLPPYAHELNPVELVWSHLKRSLANLAKRNISQLPALVKTRLKKMQYRPGLLRGFLASTRLDLTPFCNPHPYGSLVASGTVSRADHPFAHGLKQPFPAASMSAIRRVGARYLYPSPSLGVKSVSPAAAVHGSHPAPAQARGHRRPFPGENRPLVLPDRSHRRESCFHQIAAVREPSG
jgi:DDE superfamily endonuclease